MKIERLTLTVPEASKRIGMSEPVIRKAIHENKIPHIVLGTRKILIPIAALEKWLENPNKRG